MISNSVFDPRRAVPHPYPRQQHVPANLRKMVCDWHNRNLKVAEPHELERLRQRLADGWETLSSNFTAQQLTRRLEAELTRRALPTDAH